jgi:hypothetical protein
MSGANHALSLENPNAVNQSETCSVYWKIDSYKSSMMEGDGQTLIARVNSYCTFKVQVDFNLQTSGFELSKTDGMVPLDPGASGSTSWLVTANKTGAILVNAMAFSPNNDVVPVNTNSEMLNISVTTIFGLNPQLLQVLSSLGTFLGPMLTAPWWYEQWQKYREKKKQKEPLLMLPLLQRAIPLKRGNMPEAITESLHLFSLPPQYSTCRELS